MLQLLLLLVVHDDANGINGGGDDNYKLQSNLRIVTTELKTKEKWPLYTGDLYIQVP